MYLLEQAHRDGKRNLFECTPESVEAVAPSLLPLRRTVQWIKFTDTTMTRSEGLRSSRRENTHSRNEEK